MVMSDLLTAERSLFDHYELPLHSRTLRLADPDLDVVVRETGAGEPVLFVHGSGMSGATWAPVLAEMNGNRAIAVDLPGFGRSDTYEYGGRSLRRHAVAQLGSLLDALELERVPIVGTSLGAMWALCLAVDAPERVSAVVALGMPAAALPGLRGDPYFTLMTTPGIGRLASHGPTPRSVPATRKGMAKVIGPRALAAAPDEFFEVVRLGMARPGWGRAMWTHLNLAMRRGKPRPGNALTDEELRSIAAPVQFIWGDGDVYGGPEIGRRATAVLPDARIEVIEGGHAPFLDDPALCARLITRIVG
jgi:pimeloyl-ACP methyl ester carboxylesterase